MKRSVGHTALAAVMLAVILVGCSDDDGATIPEQEFGTVIVDPSPDSIDAPWSLTGPQDETGSGDTTLADMPAGAYTLTWGAVIEYAKLAQWAYDSGYCTATSARVRDALDSSTQELLDLHSGNCEISFSGGTFTVDAGKEEHPVLDVTWYGAVAYCDWLSLLGGLTRAYDHGT
jgi:hypothetical protein